MKLINRMIGIVLLLQLSLAGVEHGCLMRHHDRVGSHAMAAMSHHAMPGAVVGEAPDSGACSDALTCASMPSCSVPTSAPVRAIVAASITTSAVALPEVSSATHERAIAPELPPPRA